MLPHILVMFWAVDLRKLDLLLVEAIIQVNPFVSIINPFPQIMNGPPQINLVSGCEVSP